MNQAVDIKPERRTTAAVPQQYLSGPQLRKRWANMGETTFHVLRRAGRIPPPVYPFGNARPLWDMADILAHEAAAKEAAK